ncbi:MAG: hypothetical protein RJA98_1270 [Pseudomonadota bacterium]|jgi:hypothetical protein
MHPILTPASVLRTFTSLSDVSLRRNSLPACRPPSAWALPDVQQALLVSLLHL